ncbi:hypothetical protein MERGE_001782 [Pneumocystis wakefieldiae]|uniref:AP complex subunit beta n=1 Tax=Pneumocystis wakefieldiae TaxID=38082 RepID=A0A899FRS4_9ASCO|nr:hypothetical protein MERGE_001782 [Pneumocystis wakefieldiae]
MIERGIRSIQGLWKGETFELKTGLVSQYAHERKEAIQRTIAAMTLGKDMSMLFPDVLKNIATSDLAQKKLVYLYLMNYAKSHPDLCILAVNTFVQDSEDSNPLVRALAIRTMGCIRVDKIVDYLFEPLRKTLRDSSPYIVSNAIAALSEIAELLPEIQISIITSSTLPRILTILNESSEWERVVLLGILANYTAENMKEAESICEHVIPQFQHVNVSVVMAAIRVVMRNFPVISKDMSKQIMRKLTPSLVTLVSSVPEVQYVALRNINLILQEYPNILDKDIKVFFCKYNDLEYIKLEKLNVMIKLANKRNIDQILSELKEYASEVDIDFVRHAIRIIGQCAIKIEEAVDQCISLLLDLVNTKINYVVQEVVVVIKDIFRKYPHKYDRIIPAICENMSSFDEPNAKSSFIWIIGEYGEKISDSRNILLTYINCFKDEDIQTQLQLLTATIKLFLKNPKNNQEIIQKLFEIIESECDVPDIRDRAYIYWRLLSKDIEIAKEIVLPGKVPVFDNNIPSKLLKELICEFSTLASVFHKSIPAHAKLDKDGKDLTKQEVIEDYMQINNRTRANFKRNVENLLDIDFDEENTEKPTNESYDIMSCSNTSNSMKSSNLDDLLNAFSSDQEKQTDLLNTDMLNFL